MATKTRTLRFRVSEEMADLIERQAGEAGISTYLRRLVDADSLRGGVAGSTGGSEPPGAGSIPAPGSVPADKQLTRLIKQLEAQGNPDAEEVARKRLGL